MFKPNVLFIASWYPSRENSTLGNFVEKHAESIAPFVNLEVLYATSSSKNKQLFELDFKIKNNVRTTIVYYQKVNLNVPIISSIIKYFRLKKAYEFGVNSILEKQSESFKFDLTHCNVSYPAGVIALNFQKKYNLPFILTEHWTAFLPFRNTYDSFGFITKKLIKKTTENASIVLPVSDHLGESMKAKGLIKSYKTIPNVVDTKIFEPKKRTLDRVKILHVSSLEDEQKNISGILKTIKKISQYRDDFELQIVCDDNYDKTLTLINNLGLTEIVTLEKSKETTEIKNDFQNASFFLLYSNYETFSVVLAEAWSCGIPCLYSQCGGLTEINNPNLGLQIKKNNDADLEKGIIYLLDNINGYDKNIIREFAVNNFDYKSVGESYYKTYLDVLNSK